MTHLQAKNAIRCKQNSSALIYIKAMEVEHQRLEKLIVEYQESERRERTNAEALVKLCEQVTLVSHS